MTDAASTLSVTASLSATRQPRTGWWVAVRPGESLAITARLSGQGSYGILAGPQPGTWLLNRSRSTTGTVNYVLPAAEKAGLWWIQVSCYGGACEAEVTVNPTQLPGGAVPLYRLTRAVGDLPAGTVIQRRGVLDPSWSPGYPLGGVYPTTSALRADVTGAPLHPDSAAMVARMVETQLGPSNYLGVAAFNAFTYNTPLYVVDDQVAEVTVGFRDMQRKGYLPDTVFDKGPGGIGHFRSIPIPLEAVPATGTDGHMGIARQRPDGTWDLWDLWQAAKDFLPSANATWKGVTAAQYDADPDARLTANPIYPGWSAVWGGHVHTGTTPQGWFPDQMGASASGLVTGALSVSVREAQAGVIDHAISLVLVAPRNWPNWSWPAQRTDGFSDDPLAIMEGMRLRLRADVDLEGRFPYYSDTAGTVKLTRLHPVAKMIGQAAKQYGFIATDKAGTVGVIAESGRPFAQAAGGANPWYAILGGTPHYNVMRGFPFDQCELLPKDWGKP